MAPKPGTSEYANNTQEPQGETVNETIDVGHLGGLALHREQEFVIRPSFGFADQEFEQVCSSAYEAQLLTRMPMGLESH